MFCVDVNKFQKIRDAAAKNENDDIGGDEKENDESKECEQDESELKDNSE